MAANSKSDPVGYFRDVTLSELYGFDLFDETEEQSYYAFDHGETGDFACLVAVSDESYEARVFEEARKFSHPQMAPQSVKIVHKVTYDPGVTRLNRIQRALEQGGRDFARKINQAFVDVLVAASSAQIHAQPDESLDSLLARGSDYLGGQGSKADRLVFPRDFKNRMLVQQVVLPDSEFSNSHYVGTTTTGLAAFWSGELQHDVAVLFDSAAAITITEQKDPRFDIAINGFETIVFGLCKLNPILRDTQAVVTLAGIEQAIGRRVDAGITIPLGDAGEFLNDIKTAIDTSSIETEFKEAALYDLEQAERAYGARAFKACVVMLGAVLEGLMLGTLRRPETLNTIRIDPGFPGPIARNLGGLQRPEYVNDSDLADAIAERLSFEEYRLLIHRYIPDIEPLQVEGIQQFRNAVHPWRVIQVPAVFADYDQARAMRHLTSLAILASHILSWNP